VVNDPFDALRLPDEPVRPRTEFVARLRRTLIEALGLDTDRARAEPDLVPLPARRSAMTTSTTSPTAAAAAIGTARATPYLAVHDAAAALAFYAAALGAVEVMRVTGDDGRVGHAELTVGTTRFYLADEYPEYGVVSPRTVGATTVTLHLEVVAVDQVFAAAVAAGATALSEPADQPHGARHGTLVDPFGHRWMLSHAVETVSPGAYAARVADEGWTVTGDDSGTAGGGGPRPRGGGMWAGVNAADAPALIRFAV
jgi:PhnB protein